MASKSKIKLKRKQFAIEGKIIDLKRLASDVFAHSAAKFGVPDGCTLKLIGGENDYGLPDFIVVLSRFIFRCQVKERNHWYTEFKRHYDSTKFKSFSSIKTALTKVIHDTECFKHGRIHYEVIVTLALISELILFLYTENCELHMDQLANYWCEFWCSKKKELEKAGGLADLYQQFNNPEEAKVDIFFRDFIPVYCIPYDGSLKLQNIFDQEFNTFFNLSLESIAEMEKAVREEAVRKDEFAREFASQLVAAYENSRKRGRSSRIDTPRNTGLGIQKHEDLLRNVLRTDTETSDVQSKSSQKTAITASSVGSSGKKKWQKTLSSPLSTVGGPKPLKTSLVGVEATIITFGEDSESETPRNTGLGIQTHDDLLRDVFGADTASPQDLSSEHSQKTTRDRRGSCSQKERQKKKTRSRSSEENSEQLHTNVLGAEAAASPFVEEFEIETPVNTGLGVQTHDDLLRDVYGANVSSREPSGRSHQKTAKDRKGSASKKERQGKISSPLSTVASPKKLQTGFLGADFAASSHNLSIASRQKSAEGLGGSFRQKETQNRETKSSSNLKDIDPYFGFPRSRPAPTFDDDIGIEIPIKTGLGTQTHDDWVRDVFRTNPLSLPEEHSSKSPPKTVEDHRASSTQKEGQEKKTSRRPITEDIEPHLQYLGLPRAAKLDENFGIEIPIKTEQKEGQEEKTSQRPISDDLEPYFEFLGLPFPPKRDENFGDEVPIKTGQKEDWKQKEASWRPISDYFDEYLQYLELPFETELDEDFGVEIPVNTGLEIQTHDLVWDVFGADAVSTSQDISSTGRQTTARDNRVSATQKEKLNKITSPKRSTIEGPEHLKTSPLIAGFATSPQDLSSASHQETGRDRTVSSEKQKEIPIQSLTIDDRERLKTSPLEAGFATSVPDLPTASRQGTERDRTGSSSQTDRQKKGSSPRLSVEGPERLKTCPLGADAAKSSQKLKDSKIERLRNAEFRKMTPEEIIELLFGDELVSSDSE